MLWPGIWDGTFASHPRESETYVSSAERRMPEEMGAACKMDYLFKFEYHVPYMDVGSENEVCGTVIGLVDQNERFGVDAGEISEVATVSPGELLAGMREDAMMYCPWMLIALYLLPESDAGAREKYGSILEEWSGPAMEGAAGKVHTEAHPRRQLEAGQVSGPQKSAGTVNRYLLARLRGSPDSLYVAASHLIRNGGKRLRPYMVLKSCQLLGGKPADAMPAAAAVEMIHNFSLVHDDIMDNDEVRHGVPTTHSKFGVPLAILAGDVLFSKAYQVIASLAPQDIATELMGRLQGGASTYARASSWT